MKIVVDVFGGDYAPYEIVKGCVEAITKKDGFELILVGKQDLIEKELLTYKYNKERISIVDATDVVTNDDVPTVAIKQKKESSLVKALEILKNDNDCGAFISAGSTGAVLTGGLFLIGRIKGVLRPAISPVLPTVKKGKVLLLDSGANVDCKPEFLAQFAVMGSVFMKNIYGIEKPRVALLSNGAEEKKGNQLSKEAFQLISKLPLNFIGNIEGRDILTGDYDVVVCDGFDGNIALKSIEGTSMLMFSALKNAVNSGFRAKIGALLMKPALKKMKNELDYTKMGGAPFIGLEKIVIKSHGASKAVTICASVLQAETMARVKLSEKMQAELDNINMESLANG